MTSATAPVYSSGIVPQQETSDFIRGVVVPAVWPDCELGEVSLKRARFTPGEECAVLAELQLTPQPAKPAKLVITFAALDDLVRPTKRHQKLAIGSYSCIVSPNLGCMVEVFPADWRLPSLQEALSGETILPLLFESLSPDGDPSHHQLETRMLRYRPHSRAVISYTLHSPEGHVRGEAIGKVYRSESKSRRSWRTLEAIQAGTSGVPVIPQPLRWLPEQALVLMAKAPGQALSEQLIAEPESNFSREGVRKAAGVLLALHRVTTPQKIKRLDSDKDVKAARKLAKEMRPQTDLVREARALLKQIRDAQKAFGKPPACLTHGAFKPSALLFDAESALIVDLDACATSDPARDVGCFTSKLRELALVHQRPSLAALADDFVHEYAAGSPDALVADRARTYESAFLTGLALKNLNTLGSDEPGGSSLASALLAEATGRLASRAV